MEGDGRGAPEELRGAPDSTCLPAELRLHILSLLPPNDLALGGRLSCKDAALHFTEPTYRTAHLGQPLSDYAITAGLDSAQSALRQLIFTQKLHLPATAAASGCEANVEFALQLLQPHVFPELLRTGGGYTRAYRYSPKPRGATVPLTPDLGSAAVASGLAHLLPSLAQRCPALLDPGRTLEAAARHCDLAGLQAAWEVLGQRLLNRLIGNAESAEGVWQRLMAEAAVSSSPDARAKMAFVLKKSNSCLRDGLCVICDEVWGAAAGSGRLARLQWLRRRGYKSWGYPGALSSVLQHAGLDFIQEMEQQGHLPLASDTAWASQGLDRAAAGSPRDSAAKLRWLEDRGGPIGVPEAVEAAAAAGNLEALQLLLEMRRQLQLTAEEGEEEGEEEVEMKLVEAAASWGHVSTAAWLVQAGWPLTPECLETAIWRGDLPLVRWLVDAGCPRGKLTVSDVVKDWPWGTAADSRRLVDVLRLVVAAGWPSHKKGTLQPLKAVMSGDKPWPVWCVLRELLPSCATREAVTEFSIKFAALTGCEATLEGLVGEQSTSNARLVGEGIITSVLWYAHAAGAGDRGTLECVRRLGVPIGEWVLHSAVTSSAPLAALRWLAEQGMPINGEEVGSARRAVYKWYKCKEEQGEVEAWLRGLQG